MNEHDSPEAKKPSFLDLFGFHLALRFVGNEALLKNLNKVPSQSKSFSLYWRTPLLLNSSSEMMFLDATLTFDRSKISTKFGVLLRKSDNSICYIQASPLTFSQLSNHTQNVGIDIDLTAPDALARIMGSALMGVPNNAGNIKCFHGVENITVPVPLHYKDLAETSPFLIKSATISKLDFSTANMMLFNFEQQDKLASNTKPESNEASDTVVDTQVASQVTRAFKIWWNTSATSVENKSGPQFVKEQEKSSGSIPRNTYTKQDATDTRGDQLVKAPAQGDATSKATADASKTKSVKRPQVAGYVRVTTAKRKKKIGFAKPGTL
jgi:hypothetical protein